MSNILYHFGSQRTDFPSNGKFEIPATSQTGRWDELRSDKPRVENPQPKEASLPLPALQIRDQYLLTCKTLSCILDPAPLTADVDYRAMLHVSLETGEDLGVSMLHFKYPRNHRLTLSELIDEITKLNNSERVRFTQPVRDFVVRELWVEWAEHQKEPRFYKVHDGTNLIKMFELVMDRGYQDWIKVVYGNPGPLIL